MSLKVIRILQDNKNWKIVSDGASTVFSYPTDESITTAANGWSPNTDILESEDSIIIRIEIAGVKREKLSLKSQGDAIIITGNRSDAPREGRVYYHQMEISYGPFEKIIALPPYLLDSEISAQYSDGLLEITILKKHETIQVPIASDVKTDK